jgi:hypothetical protein
MLVRMSVMKKFMYGLVSIIFVLNSQSVNAIEIAESRDASINIDSAFVSKSEHENAISDLTRCIISLGVLYEYAINDNGMQTDKIRLETLINSDANIPYGPQTLHGEDDMKKVVKLINIGINKLFSEGRMPKTFVPIGGEGNFVEHYLLEHDVP